MRLLDRDTFRQWTDGTALRWTEDYAYQDCPTFGAGEKSTPWPWPKPEGHTRPSVFADFIGAAVRAASLDKSGGFYLWPLCGLWTPGSDQWPVYRLRNLLLERLGVPIGFTGCLYFLAEQDIELLTAIYTRCSILDEDLGDGTDDVVLYPSHGELSLHFHHEEITWALAASAEPLQQFEDSLKRLGWAWLRDPDRNQWSGFLGDLDAEGTVRKQE
jgi:hypothetical protein